MRTTEDLHLFDFVELRLKSKDGFSKAYEVALSSGLAAYLQKFIVINQETGHANFIVDNWYMNVLHKIRSSCYLLNVQLKIVTTGSS